MVDNRDMKTLAYDDYNIGIIVGRGQILDAAQTVLDKKHTSLPSAPGDRNDYILGEIGNFNVAIGFFRGFGPYEIGVATIAVAGMKRTFSSLRLYLLVGIGYP